MAFTDTRVIIGVDGDAAAVERGTSSLRVTFGAGTQQDAFARLRTSHPFTLFDSKFLFDKGPLFWSESLSGAASSTYTTPTVTLAVGSSADAAVRQTRMRFNYQPGKSQQIFMTGTWTREDGVVKRSGYWDGTDGIYFELSGTSASFNVMKGGVVTSAAQEDWFDPLDGTGPSQTTLNLSGSELLFIDFGWLSEDPVRCGFMLSGTPTLAHTFYHANRGIIGPYMNNPNLPIRHELRSWASAGSMGTICVTVISEGGADPAGVINTYDTALNFVTIPGNLSSTVLFAIRLSAGREASYVAPEALDISIDGTGDFYWSLRLNPTVAGSLAWFPVPSSSLEAASGTSAITVTDGIKIGSGFGNTTKFTGTGTIATPITNALRMGRALDGTQDILVLAVAANAGISAFGSLTWREIP